MTAQFSVSAEPAAEQSGAVAAVIASLPISLRPADDAGELAAIDGGAGWTTRASAALARGARGIMVVDPVAEDADGLRVEADRAGIPVVVDAPWTHNPAVATSAEALRRAEQPGTFLEVRTDAPAGADLQRNVLAQLCLIRAAVSPVRALTLVRRNAAGYDALATLDGGARASIGTILTDALPHCARLRMLNPTTEIRLEIPSPDTARAGTVIVSGPDGANMLVTEYETAHRVAWRRLHHLVDNAGPAPDLAGFAEDMAVLHNAW